jgi:hypothetical protein
LKCCIVRYYGVVWCGVVLKNLFRYMLMHMYVYTE